MALLVTACAGEVRPTAASLAERLQRDPVAIDAASLQARGFERVNGAGPELREGTCYEKARTHPVYGGFAGVDVVRVCLSRTEPQAFVFAMHTHGRGWIELYPVDMRASGAPADPFFNISDASQKRLKP